MQSKHRLDTEKIIIRSHRCFEKRVKSKLRFYWSKVELEIKQLE